MSTWAPHRPVVAGVAPVPVAAGAAGGWAALASGWAALAGVLADGVAGLEGVTGGLAAVEAAAGSGWPGALAGGSE